MPKPKTGAVGSCEDCAHYQFDDEGEYWFCDVDLDEDEMYRFLHGATRSCPYYQPDDEYAIVRKQN